MKKIIAIVLTICFVFSFSLNVFAFDSESAYDYISSESVETRENNKNENNLDVNWIHSEEFLLELEKDGINLENHDTYDICIMIEIREPSNFDKSIFSAANINVEENNYDEALRNHRQMVRDHYILYNERMVNELGIDKYNYSISSYSPFIEIVFDDIDDYIRDEQILLELINDNSDKIASACSYAFYEPIIEEVQSNIPSQSPPYNIDDAFEDIGVKNSSYTGEGVKVGIIEMAPPSSMANFKEGYYTLINCTGDAHEHGFIISSIIGGTSGIAENAHIYFLQWEGFTESFDRLINECNVNIINASWGYNGHGYYTNYDQCIDTIAYTTGCTIAVSAGNSHTSNPNGYVTSPGYSLNAITVGGVDGEKKHVQDSLWNVPEDFILKPDVVAPGENLQGIPNSSSSHRGTSYATPMVVGTIALLMEEFPLLKSNPALVKSVLHL